MRLFKLAPPAGLEPATCGLTVRRSTNWAKEELFCLSLAIQQVHQKIWCLEAESNHRHEDFQSSALPTELSRQKNGADYRNRTGDLLITSQLLYLLS